MKKAILVTSFGTSYPETLRLNIEAVENDIRDAYPDYEIRRAFTSPRIIRKIKERDGISIDRPEEALRRLKEDGYDDVVIMPLHLMPGKESDDIQELFRRTQEEGIFSSLKLGRPLLFRNDDYLEVCSALKEQLGESGDKEAVILIGHGSYHPGNACFSQLKMMLDFLGHRNVFVGTVEGFPKAEHIIPILKEKRIRKALLMPFLLVAGEHAMKDMAGEEDSWKTVLNEEGIDTEIYMHGLGENRNIRKVYLNRLKDAINGEELYIRSHG